MSTMRQYIGNLRMYNNAEQMIITIKEIIYTINEYSEVPINVQPEQRYWKKCWIDKIGEIVNERGIMIHNKKNSFTKITKNQMIMDYIWDYLKEIGKQK